MKVVVEKWRRKKKIFHRHWLRRKSNRGNFVLPAAAAAPCTTLYVRARAPVTTLPSLKENALPYPGGQLLSTDGEPCRVITRRLIQRRFFHHYWYFSAWYLALRARVNRNTRFSHIQHQTPDLFWYLLAEVTRMWYLLFKFLLILMEFIFPTASYGCWFYSLDFGVSMAKWFSL